MFASMEGLDISNCQNTYKDLKLEELDNSKVEFRNCQNTYKDLKLSRRRKNEGND